MIIDLIICKMLLKRTILFFVLSIFSGYISAENIPIDTTIRMKEVVIRSARLKNFAIGSSIQTIDSLSMQNHGMQSFGELLKNKTSIIINSYGPGGLATSSLRGGGSSHTIRYNHFLGRGL